MQAWPSLSYTNWVTPSIAHLWLTNWHASQACILQVWPQFTNWQAKLELYKLASSLYPSKPEVFTHQSYADLPNLS
jgi:hypothetical protein